MNITFLIGNGFDLAKLLKTSYINFYEYMDKEEKLHVDNIFFNAIRNYIHENSDIDAERNDYKDLDWSDFEKALGSYTEILTNRRGAEKYLNDLIDFREEFLAYIRLEEAKFEVDQKQAQEYFKDLVQNFYKGIGDKNETTIKNAMNKRDPRSFVFNFINFNYTKTLSSIIEKTTHIQDPNRGYFKASKPIHVHRDIDNGAFLGVNDKSQIFNTDVFEDDEFADLIKPEMQEAEFSEIPSEVENKIKQTSIFFIYGMSLGETDKIWWQEIGNRLKSYSESYLIINHYIHEDERAKVRRQPSIKRRKRRETILEFLNHLDFTNEEKEIIKKRVFVVIGSQHIL